VSAGGRRPGALVLSLDFELHWGVRDRIPAERAGWILGAREAVPELLGVLEQHGAAATWATVGFLMASGRAQLEAFSPRLRPRYADPRLDPYAEPVGEDEARDPLHFARSLVELVRKTPRQEIGTHTFSHYYCGEPGQDGESFAADLDAALAVAGELQIPLRSIVFPRNQHNSAYDGLLRERGIGAYRGNPPGWAWRFEGGRGGRQPLRRALRFLDSHVALGDDTTGWEEIRTPSGLANVRASRFLRPGPSRIPGADALRLRRILRGMRHAARAGRVYHLWWHPHNFALHRAERLAFLGAVLAGWGELRDRFGMRSLTMAEVAAEAP
jgi:peptidoglycan/xylan/chitin deacetylase (PgdA/CDA1 family)